MSNRLFLRGNALFSRPKEVLFDGFEAKSSCFFKA